MTDRELLQMALDMIESPHPGIRTGFSDAMIYREKVKTTIEALRARLAQPEGEWVDLTNEEIDDIWAEFNDGYGIIEETLWGYERAIEAKLREKNG